MKTQHSVSTTLRGHTPRQDIQGMRGLAVLLVVVFHAGLPLPGGFVGVDIFFVISGFVITGLLMRELTRSGSINFRRFYARRVRRLIPALTLVVLVTLIASFLLGSPFDAQQEVTALTGAGALLMVANGVIFLNTGEYFATPPTNNPLLNTWSLSVEEQFYLFFPAFILILWLLARKWRTPSVRWFQSRKLVITFGIAVLALASFVLSVGMTYGLINYRLSDPDWFAFYSSPTRAWEFAAGAAVFLVCGNVSATQRPRLGGVLVLTGAAGMVTSAFVITESMPFPGFIAALPVLATCLALAGGSLASAWSSKFLAFSPIARLGDVSYSWYLWHWPLIAFAVMLFSDSVVTKTTAAIASLLLAFLTLRFIENPIRFSTRLRGGPTVLLAGVCVGLVLVASVSLYAGASRNWGNPNLQIMNEQVSAKHLWQTSGCDTPAPLGQRDAGCLWNSEANGVPLYLVGDSMAGMLSEAVLGAGTALNRPVLPGTLGACPFIDADFELDGRTEVDCTTFVRESLAWLQVQEPGDVILSSSFGYITMDAARFSNVVGATSQLNKAQLYVAGLTSAVRKLSDVGHRVHVILPTPGFPQTLNSSGFWYPSQCATFEALADITQCGMQRPLAEVISETAELEAMVTESLRGVRGIPLQLRSELCDATTCATNVGNEWTYLDGTHLSVNMSEALAPFFVEQIHNGFTANFTTN